MSYVSIGYDIDVYGTEVDRATIGTDDGGAGNNVTVCINKAATGLTRAAVIRILETVINRLNDGRFDDTVTV